VNRLAKKNYLGKTTLMHCVSEYPTSLTRASLNQIVNLKEYGCKVGFSDHSGEVSTALFASMLGIDLLEFHITPNKLFFGPDTSSSLDLPSAEFLIKTLDDFKVLSENNLSKNELFEYSKKTAEIFGRSIYWARSLAKGSKIQLIDMAFLKPATSGIPATNYEDLVGKVTLSNVQKGTQISPGDFA
jgi:N-acetylneuraminate synthase